MSPILSAVFAAASFTEILKTLPRGNVLPQAEAQVRPLLRLPDPGQQVEVWATAVEQADGGQPSAPQVKKLVFEVLHPGGAEPARLASIALTAA